MRAPRRAATPSLSSNKTPRATLSREPQSSARSAARQLSARGSQPAAVLKVVSSAPVAARTESPRANSAQQTAHKRRLSRPTQRRGFCAKLQRTSSLTCAQSPSDSAERTKRPLRLAAGGRFGPAAAAGAAHLLCCGQAVFAPLPRRFRAASAER